MRVYHQIIIMAANVKEAKQIAFENYGPQCEYLRPFKYASKGNNFYSFRNPQKWKILTKDDPAIQDAIQLAIKEKNYFWSECVVGSQYGSWTIIRVSPGQEPTANEFIPIARVKYGSPYKGHEAEGHLIKYYDNEI